MHFVIIGCGAIGLELARHWRAAGHRIVGTTTSAARVPEIEAAGAEAAVLASADRDGLRALVAGADAAIFAARPRLRFASTTRERVAQYRSQLIGGVGAVTSAQRRIVLLSSMVVYGDAGPGDAPVDERTPPTTALETAAQAFSAAERLVLEWPDATVLRLPDVVGHPDDMDDAALLRFAHEHFGGVVPFAPDALLYRIDYRDAAAAVVHTVDTGLVGVFNAVPDAVVPPDATTAFGKLAAELGLPPLEFSGSVRTPTRPISSAKLRATGFRFRYA